jgi:hypothetical protein
MISAKDGQRLERYLRSDEGAAATARLHAEHMVNLKSGTTVRVGGCAALESAAAATGEVALNADGSVVPASAAGAGAGGGGAPSQPLARTRAELLVQGGDILLLEPDRPADLADAHEWEWEFLAAAYGGPLVRKPLQLVHADPPTGCAPLANAAAARGRLVLVERGGCLFLDKVRHAEAAGAAVVAIANNAPGLFRLVAPDMDPREVSVSAISVTQATGAALRALLQRSDEAAAAAAAAAARPVLLQLIRSRVQADDWELLGRLQSPAEWTESTEERNGLWQRLRSFHDPTVTARGHPQRMAAVAAAYAAAEAHFGALAARRAAAAAAEAAAVAAQREEREKRQQEAASLSNASEAAETTAAEAVAGEEPGAASAASVSGEVLLEV